MIKIRFSRKNLIPAIAMLPFLLLSAQAFGQSAGLSGTVMDASKAVLPGATITATNTDPGVKTTITTNYAGVYNPLGLCKFIIKGQVGPERTAQIVNKALGWDWTPEDVLITGDRLFQLKRLINLRLGITAADDVLPKRLLTQPRPSGEAAGVLPDMQVMLPIYYQLRDWDEKGVPRPERLAQLGLDMYEEKEE